MIGSSGTTPSNVIEPSLCTVTRFKTARMISIHSSPDISFLARWEPEMFTARTGTCYKQVGKEIAHLTYDRLGKAPEQRTWSAMQIAVVVEARLDDFRVDAPWPYSLEILQS